jgi:phthiocerol/phenolphthiocerol synthesis type-I polyketide synthase E
VSSPPLAATYIADAGGEARHLAITVLELVADAASWEILLTDIFTGFAQRLAGQDITLPPTSTTWHEWSQRCAALATHPTVLQSRDYWLENAAAATMRLADHDVADRPGSDDLVRLSSTLTIGQADEIDRMRRRFQFGLEEVVLAALGRTIADTIGEGVVAVNLAGDGRSVLKPDIDPRRTVGGFGTIYPVPLRCEPTAGAEAMQQFDAVHDTLAAVPHHGIGHGLLAYLYAPTARTLGALAPPDIFVSNQGAIPDLPPGQGPVQFDIDTAMPVRDKVAGLGHAIEMRLYRSSSGLHVDWWYDTRRVAPAKMEALVERFPVALGDLVGEATASGSADGGPGGVTVELGLVDLSAE